MVRLRGCKPVHNGGRCGQGGSRDNALLQPLRSSAIFTHSVLVLPRGSVLMVLLSSVAPKAEIRVALLSVYVPPEALFRVIKVIAYTPSERDSRLYA